MSPVARYRATQAFDLVAGFTYTQTLLASVEAGLLELLAVGPVDTTAIAERADLSPAAATRLIKAAAAIDLAEEVEPGWWMLGQKGAALQANEGALAMIRHHRLLYRDLADPLALLRANRTEPTSLSSFWQYAAEGNEAEATEYSMLMATSQEMVSEQVLAAYDFSQHERLLDIGGGHGRFISAVADANPTLQFGIFDLPPVLAGTANRLADRGLDNRVTLHPGDFFDSPIPEGYDCISLVRILHDHDDEQALHLLKSIRQALPPSGRLVIAEPMADTPGAKAMGDTYFGLYLWAMNAGRPRTSKEIQTMLKDAGFPRSRHLRTHQPMLCSVIVSFL